MSYDVRATTVDELLAVGQELFAANWDEAGGRQRFRLREDDYRAWWAAGIMCCIGAWLGAELVGYSVAIVSPRQHTGELVGVSDSLYVSPPHRGDLHQELMRSTEIAASQLGATRFAWGAKPGGALDLILRHRGDELREHIYEREL